MIIDTHLHYSQPPSPERPYDARAVGAHPQLAQYQRLLVEEVLSEVAPEVDRIVQVTNTKMGYDNRYSLEGADRYPQRVLGIVARFDPFTAGLERRLGELAADPRILAVRFTFFTEETRPWLREGVLDPFFAAAEKLDVAVQLWAPGQAAEMAAVARRYRGIRFLIDHMALNRDPPRPHEEVFCDWPDVLSMAKAPNVWTKVSYFPEATCASEAYPFPRAQERLRELYDEVGAQRLVWGSNFPGVRHACSYLQGLDFIRQHCNFLPASDKAAILGGNFLAHFGRRTARGDRNGNATPASA